MPGSCWRNFLTRTGLVHPWTDFCGRLTLYRVCRQEVRQQQRTYGLHKRHTVSVQMATILSTNCNCWYCVRTAKATFPYWKLLFLSIFKQLLLKNCTVDFVEICNVCITKAIIKTAKRIFDSDKICRSYCDFYFGVTFLNTINGTSMSLDASAKGKSWLWCRHMKYNLTNSKHRTEIKLMG